MTRFTTLLLVLWVLFGTWACSSRAKQVPAAKAGVLDLRKWDLERRTPIALDGEWEFYWGTFLQTDSASLVHTARQFIKVPSAWNVQKRLPGQGYASYKLTILLGNKYPDLAFKLYSFGTAYRLFANGRLLARNGTVGNNRSDTQPHALPQICTFAQYEDRIELVIEVANYHDWNGGMWSNIYLGSSRNIQIEHDRSVALDLLLTGCLLIMVVYHLGLYGLRRRDRSALYFAIVCTLFGIRALLMDEKYLVQLFPTLPWWLTTRIEYLTMYAGFSFYILFYRSMFKEEFSRRLSAFLKGIFFTLSLFALIAPVIWLSGMSPYISMLMLAIGVYVFYTLVLAVWHKREAAWIFFAGYVAFFGAVTNDIFYELYLIETGYWTSMGLLVFVVCQALALSMRFAQSYTAVEELSEGLERKVAERTQEITEQNQELATQKEEIEKQAKIIQKKNHNIQASINYASRIQQAILGSQEAITSNFEDSFILLKPKDIVSGDFYWYTEVKRTGSILPGLEHKTLFFKVIVAADCTGHGIPGAFMTVLGNTLLDEIINENRVTNPGKILSLLDRKLLMKLQKHNVNDGMDMSMLIFDDENNKVSFAGANNPLYYVREGHLTELKGSKFPIGSSQYKDKKKFESHTIDYQSGDIFYIFSDGFQDQFGGDQGMKYFKKNFRKLLLDIHTLPMAEQRTALDQELARWRGDEPQTDDVLIIGIKV